MLIRVEMPRSLVFGLVSDDKEVIAQAAPVAKWQVGKPVAEVVRYWQRRGARVTVSGEAA